MTKKLSELFELPEDGIINLDDSSDTPLIDVLDQEEITQTALTNLEKIEASLPLVSGLEEADEELDELARLATDSFRDLSDLGMQVEPRFASEIFSAAGTMLGHAISAKTAKINKKLKQLDIQLKKAQLDAKLKEKTEEIDNTPLGDGKSLDRNELLKLYTNKPQ